MMRAAARSRRITEEHLRTPGGKGGLKVVAVDDVGNVTKCDFIVDGFLLDGRTTFPTGTSIVAETTAERSDVHGERQVSIAPESVESCKIITAAFNGGRGRIGNDALFGSRLRRRVGEAWSGDADAIASLFGGDSNVVKREDVAGAATLVSTAVVDGKAERRFRDCRLVCESISCEGRAITRSWWRRATQISLDILAVRGRQELPRVGIREGTIVLHDARHHAGWERRSPTDTVRGDQEITRTYRKQGNPR